MTSPVERIGQTTTDGRQDGGPGTPPGGVTTDQVAQHYDQTVDVVTAAIGDHMHCGYWTGPEDDSSLADATVHLTDLVGSKLGVGAGQCVLDAGSGVGGPAVRLARTTGAWVIGVNISGEQLKRATELAERESVQDRVQFEYADMMELPFPPESFDGAIAMESIFHVPDRGAAMRRLAQVLRPGARLVVTDFFDPGGGDGPQLLDPALLEKFMGGTLPTWDEYRRMVQEAGLELDEITDITEQTMRSHTMFTDAVQEHRSEFEDTMGAELVDMLVDGVDVSAAAPGMFRMGYLLLVARRGQA